MRLDVRVRVRKAFYDLLRAEDELRIHDGHVAIARQAVEAARIKYTVGKVPQQDILHSQLSARRALGYAAELRFPGDTSKDERNRRVEFVIVGAGDLTPHGR